MLPESDLDKLMTSLSGLSARARSAFAAACAERQAPAYARVSAQASRGDPDMLANALEALWSDLEGRKISSKTLQRYVSLCEAYIKQNQDIKGLFYASNSI